MTDVVDKHTRSRMMSGIKGQDTKPELILRSGLHSKGFRYRLHDKKLPGSPDIVLPKYAAALFINGCFWHGHNCHLFKWPSTRKEFWREKITRNRERDQRNLEQCNRLGWRTLTIWECALKGKTSIGIQQVVEVASRWIQFDTQDAEITGKELD